MFRVLGIYNFGQILKNKILWYLISTGKYLKKKSAIHWKQKYTRRSNGIVEDLGVNSPQGFGRFKLRPFKFFWSTRLLYFWQIKMHCNWTKLCKVIDCLNKGNKSQNSANLKKPNSALESKLVPSNDLLLVLPTQIFKPSAVSTLETEDLCLHSYSRTDNCSFTYISALTLPGPIFSNFFQLFWENWPRMTKS